MKYIVTMLVITIAILICDAASLPDSIIRDKYNLNRLVELRQSLGDTNIPPLYRVEECTNETVKTILKCNKLYYVDILQIPVFCYVRNALLINDKENIFIESDAGALEYINKYIVDKQTTNSFICSVIGFIKLNSYSIVPGGITELYKSTTTTNGLSEIIFTHSNGTYRCDMRLKSDYYGSENRVRFEMKEKLRIQILENIIPQPTVL